jgi:hypothetical protein
MEIYRIPRREVPVRIRVDDGRTLDGTLFTAATVSGRRPEDVLQHLNEMGEDFVPLVCGPDSFLLNKAGIIWVQVTGVAAQEIAGEAGSGRQVPVRFSLAGGISVVGTLVIVMPQERSRVLDYLNAAGRFLPLFGEGTVTLVQRRFVVTVRSAEGAESASCDESEVRVASLIRMQRAP